MEKYKIIRLKSCFLGDGCNHQVEVQIRFTSNISFPVQCKYKKFRLTAKLDTDILFKETKQNKNIKSGPLLCLHTFKSNKQQNETNKQTKTQKIPLVLKVHQNQV